MGNNKVKETVRLKTLGIDLNDNQRRFLAQVLKNPGAKRNDLANKLGFSAQTAMRVVGPLVDAGIVVEIDEITGSRGKPPKMVLFSNSSLLTIGIVLAPGRVTVGFCDLDGNVVTRETERKVFKSCKEQLVAIENILFRLSENLPTQAKVVSAAIASSGFFLEKERRIVSRVDPKGWANVDLKEHIENFTGVPTFIENDARVIATSILEETGLRDFMCVYLDVGIGGAIVSDGCLIQGSTGNAGTIGRLFGEGDDRPSERSLRKTIGIDCWDNWDGLENISTEQRSRLDDWIEKVGEQFSLALNSALALLDFDTAYICSRIPDDILNLLVKKIEFKPLGANLDNEGLKSFVMPPPKVLTYKAKNFTGMTHVLATRYFFELKHITSSNPSFLGAAVNS